MKRRAFFKAFGIGATVGAAAGVREAHAAVAHQEKRDLAWARERIAEGHRVRLEAWRVPVEDRDTERDENDASITFHMGQPSGVTSLDHIALTPLILEGPWEVVPEEDLPKPPPPPEPRAVASDNYLLSGGHNGWWEPQPADLTLTAGRGGEIRLKGGK
jgi:hypothetical protein